MIANMAQLALEDKEGTEKGTSGLWGMVGAGGRGGKGTSEPASGSLGGRTLSVEVHRPSSDLEGQREQLAGKGSRVGGRGLPPESEEGTLPRGPPRRRNRLAIATPGRCVVSA